MDKPKTRIGLATFCIVLGILFSYVMQQAPSPVLLEIQDYYGIVNNDTLLNLCVSIIYASIVMACLVGAKVEQKIGLKRLFIWTMALMIVGGAMSMLASAYLVLVVGRFIWGFGFGLGIQFIGSAIMEYYSPVAREKMNTLNGMFPFIGTVICFLLMSPLSKAMGGFKPALAIWVIPMIIAMVIWIVTINDENMPHWVEKAESEEPEFQGSVIKNLWSRKPIRLLCITFVCDFCCYSYVAVIVPTLFFEGTEMSMDTAGLMAAIAFPLFGLVGSGLGGIILNRTGLRKSTLVAGQIIKFVGLTLATLFIANPVCLVAGICLFGLGNGIWMPAFYCVPMDLENMTSNLAGAAFAYMSAFGMAAGFFAPTIGGAITDSLRASFGGNDPLAAHVHGLRWSLFIFGCMNLISTVCMLIYKETGKCRVKA